MKCTYIDIDVCINIHAYLNVLNACANTCHVMMVMMMMVIYKYPSRRVLYQSDGIRASDHHCSYLPPIAGMIAGKKKIWRLNMLLQGTVLRRCGSQPKVMSTITR